jgi:hypothetical protein
MSNYPELRTMVRGAYDLQQLRMQAGLRLCANFRAKLKQHEDEPELDEDTGELSEEAQGVIDKLRKSFALLTTGIAKNRTLPAREGFVGDPLIGSYSELVLVAQYMALESEEKKQFRQFESLLAEVPIYLSYLSNQKGVGPAMAGVLLTTLDPHKARHVSSFWKYAGIDVATDGRGRSRRAEHLVERSYINKDGKEATRQGVTYNPWLKTKVTGVLAGSFLRSGSPWREAYDNYKRRIETDPNREKCSVVEWKKRHKAGENVERLWTPGRINNAAKRYMCKQFLADLWTNWRKLEGLPVTPSYNEARRGYAHAAE